MSLAGSLFRWNVQYHGILNGGLPNAQTGRKHQAEKCFKFRVCNRGKEGLHFLPGGNKRQLGVKLPERELVRIPGPAQDISGKKTQLGNTGIDGTVRKLPSLLDPADKIPHFNPGNILQGSAEDIRKISRVSRDVGGISCEGMVGKTTEGDHLPVLF